MTARTNPDQPSPPRRDRRLDVVVVLLFGLMITAGLALFPVSVASNKLSGLWITLCASIGLN